MANSNGLDFGHEPVDPSAPVTAGQCHGTSKLIAMELRHQRSCINQIKCQTDKIPKLEQAMAIRDGVDDKLDSVKKSSRSTWSIVGQWILLVLTVAGMLVGAVIWINDIQKQRVDEAEQIRQYIDEQQQTMVHVLRKALDDKERGS